MRKRFDTPATRKRKLLLDGLLLLCALLLLVLALDFPILTARQALRATERSHLFPAGTVLAQRNNPRPPDIARSLYDRYYITRWGNWYAQCGVNHYGLFWQPGRLEAVENIPSLPLVPLLPESGRNDGFLLVISNDPAIAAVEISFPYAAHGVEGANSRGYFLLTARQDSSEENCFLVPYGAHTGFFPYLDALRLRGYNSAGTLIYETPVPPSWAKEYGLAPDGRPPSTA